MLWCILAVPKSRWVAGAWPVNRARVGCAAGSGSAAVADLAPALPPAAAAAALQDIQSKMQGELQHGLAVCEAEVLSFIEPLEQVGGGLAAPSESDREPGAGVSDRCGVHAQDRTGQGGAGAGASR